MPLAPFHAWRYREIFPDGGGGRSLSDASSSSLGSTSPLGSLKRTLSSMTSRSANASPSHGLQKMDRTLVEVGSSPKSKFLGRTAPRELKLIALRPLHVDGRKLVFKSDQR
eukprot:TRINITY_DN40790_c0_g1_i1.p1 TRINITY_DN40790_c0_g1~~TRINITY_DN40790_c0_g1_i1.p1  ORF type:complete len:111 (-),score=20.23 TRINITY_DN40790_c0_g1_i1:31-363(-)